MPGTVVVIPVRGSSSAKTRLSPLFTEDERLALVWAMLRRLLAEIDASGAIDHTTIVTRDPAAVRAHVQTGNRVSALDQTGGPPGLNGALHLARAWAVDAGYESMLLLPGDLPIVSAEDIRALASAKGDLIVASDRGEEGTNALRIDLRRWGPTPFRFQMGPGSFAHHFAEAGAAGTRATPLFRVGIAHDLDSPRDWADLTPDLQRTLLQEMHDVLSATGHLA